MFETKNLMSKNRKNIGLREYVKVGNFECERAI